MENESPTTSDDDMSQQLTIDRFTRKAIDKAFGQGTSNLGFTKHGEKTGVVVATSPAVKSGLVRLCLDGTVNRRCTAVRRGLIELDEEGNVVKADSLLCEDPQILWNKDGSISSSSPAVYNGLIRLKDNGEIDRRSSAVAMGLLKLDKETGTVIKESSILCSPTQLYLHETNAAHKHSFQVADTITQCKYSFCCSFCVSPFDCLSILR